VCLLSNPLGNPLGDPQDNQPVSPLIPRVSHPGSPPFNPLDNPHNSLLNNLVRNRRCLRVSQLVSPQDIQRANHQVNQLVNLLVNPLVSLRGSPQGSPLFNPLDNPRGNPLVSPLFNPLHSPNNIQVHFPLIAHQWSLLVNHRVCQRVSQHDNHFLAPPLSQHALHCLFQHIALPHHLLSYQEWHGRSDLVLVQHMCLHPALQHNLLQPLVTILITCGAQHFTMPSMLSFLGQEVRFMRDPWAAGMRFIKKLLLLPSFQE